MTIGAKIKALLEAKNMTVYRLSVESKVSRSYIGQIIHEKNNNPSMSTIKSLAVALDVSPNDLI